MLVLNAMVRKSSHLLEFNQTHNAAMFSSKCETLALQIGYITPSFVGHFFRVEVKLDTFCQFSIVHFHLISNIFLCRYASITPRMKVLTWCRVMSGRAFRVGPGSGLSLSKYFGPAYKKFYNILRVTTFFFREVDFFYSPR